MFHCYLENWSGYIKLENDKLYEIRKGRLDGSFWISELLNDKFTIINGSDE